MADSTLIYDCENCGQTYCGNCTNAVAYNKYCSTRCEKEAEREKEKAEALEKDARKPCPYCKKDHLNYACDEEIEALKIFF